MQKINMNWFIGLTILQATRGGIELSDANHSACSFKFEREGLCDCGFSMFLAWVVNEKNILNRDMTIKRIKTIKYHNEDGESLEIIFLGENDDVLAKIKTESGGDDGYHCGILICRDNPTYEGFYLRLTQKA